MRTRCMHAGMRHAACLHIRIGRAAAWPRTAAEGRKQPWDADRGGQPSLRLQLAPVAITPVSSPHHAGQPTRPPAFSPTITALPPKAPAPTTPTPPPPPPAGAPPPSPCPHLPTAPPPRALPDPLFPIFKVG
jgi:hypothetical protein